jgi:hypothetical protein
MLVLVAACTESIEGSPVTPPGDPRPGPTGSLPVSAPIWPPPGFECPPAILTFREASVVDTDCALGLLFAESVGPVMDDTAGGVVFRDSRHSGIRRIGSEGGLPVDLVVPAPTESVELEDVTLLDGKVEVWFTRFSGSTPHDAVQTLERIPIEGGTSLVVAAVGDWESWSTVTVAPDVLALQTRAEGRYTFGLMTFDAVRPPQPWNPYYNIEETPAACSGCPVAMVVSDDGRRVAFLEPKDDGIDVIVLVAIDLDSASQLLRLEIPGIDIEEFSHPSLDIVGDIVLVNPDGILPRRALWADLSVAHPSWQAMPEIGVARLLRSDLDLRALELG